MPSSREHINDFFNGQPFMILCALALIVATAVALAAGVEEPPVNSNGIFFTIQDKFITNHTLSAVVNVLCILATGFIMLALNKVYNYVRSATHLFASAFFLLEIANPYNLVAFDAGTLLCLITAITFMPLFSSFQDHHSQRSIFLIFTMVATGSMFHYAFVMLIPAFILGFFNMHALGLKGFLAMLFGLITPFWIVLGLGFASPDDFIMPHVTAIWSLVEQPQANLLIILAAVTVLLGIILASMNLATIINYRMQTRVYNSFFVITLVLTVLAMGIDYRDMMVFLPLLNLMVAVQLAHTHTLRNFPYRYVLLLLFIAGTVGFYIGNMLLIES